MPGVVGVTTHNTFTRRRLFVKIMLIKRADGTRDVLVIPRRGQGKAPVMVQGVEKADLETTVVTLMANASEEGVEPSGVRF